RPVEYIGLVDLHPGQLAALGTELVALARELFLLRQQRFARGDPFLAGNDRMLHLRSPPTLQTVSDRFKTALKTVAGTRTRSSFSYRARSSPNEESGAAVSAASRSKKAS